MDLIVPALVASATAGVWLWIIRRFDKLEPEPILTLLYAGILGGVASIIPAGLLNAAASAFLDVDIGMSGPSALASLLFYLFVGFNEEFWKAAVTVVLIKDHKDFDEPIDGMIYAMTVCLGFAALENLEYILEFGLGVIVARSLLSVPAHLAFGAIWGYGFTKAKFLVKEHHYTTTMAPYIIWAALAHSVFNFLLVSQGSWSLLAVVPFILFLILSTRKKLAYLLLQSPFRALEECLDCGKLNRKGSNFCSNCGQDLRPEFYQLCPTCRTRYSLIANFCPECGQKSIAAPSPRPEDSAPGRSNQEETGQGGCR